MKRLKVDKVGIDSRLRCDVARGELVIRIGIGTLAFCVREDPAHVLPGKVRVRNRKQLARDIRAALMHEDEQGNTLVTKVLDDAILHAFEDGAQGMHYPDCFKCQFCAREFSKKLWLNDECPECGEKYDATLAQESDD